MRGEQRDRKGSLNELLLVEFLVEERTKDVDLVC
jgi:hypothetical protein